jgi:hypothetical protein
MSNGDKARSIPAVMAGALERVTRKWTRQRKAEERHPAARRYREMRLTTIPRTTQKEIAAEVMEECYRHVSGLRNLPAQARQIYYAARGKIMEATDNRELGYGYFSQTLLPNYQKDHPKICSDWNVIYDARGHCEEPHTNRRFGCGTLEVDNYLAELREPEIVPAGFRDAEVETIGPDGGYAAVFYCEKEGFNPLWKAVDLANRYDLFDISNKGLSVTAARKLIDHICGEYGTPAFVLTDFDFDGIKNRGTLCRDSRRYEFGNKIEPVDLGLRLADIIEIEREQGGKKLEREPAAFSKVSREKRRRLLTGYGATPEEVEFLLDWRIELNALTSEQLVALVERKLTAYGLKKIVPDEELLAETYRAFHRSGELREEFEDLMARKEESTIKVPKNLKQKVRAILAKHPDLRWDDAVRLVLDATALEDVRAKKQEAREKSGDFTGVEDDEEAASEPV